MSAPYRHPRTSIGLLLKALRISRSNNWGTAVHRDYDRSNELFPNTKSASRGVAGESECRRINSCVGIPLSELKTCQMNVTSENTDPTVIDVYITK